MEEIVALCKRRGFVFPSSEIYGGLGSTYDYGHYGVLLKNNVKAEWWRAMLQDRDDIVALDSAILQHPRVWEASGHLEGFTDPLVQCLGKCKRRWREDHLREAVEAEAATRPTLPGECGGELSEPRQFNLMFETHVGPVARRGLGGLPAAGDGAGDLHQLQERARLRAQEAAVRDRPDRQVVPQRDHPRQLHLPHPRVRADGDGVLRAARPTPTTGTEHWIEERERWYTELGIRPDHLRVRAHDADELSHYSSATSDIEYLFPIGWSELEGIANRGDFDLTQHAKFSGEKLEYFDQQTKERYVPHVIEPAAGADRAAARLPRRRLRRRGGRGPPAHRAAPPPAAGPGQGRRSCRWSPRRACRRRPARSSRTCAARLPAEFDEGGSIGKRYRRQDEIGTPWGITVDHQTMEDDTVTLRDRDSPRADAGPDRGPRRRPRRPARAALAQPEAGLTPLRRPHATDRLPRAPPGPIRAPFGAKSGRSAHHVGNKCRAEIVRNSGPRRARYCVGDVAGELKALHARQHGVSSPPWRCPTSSGRGSSTRGNSVSMRRPWSEETVRYSCGGGTGLAIFERPMEAIDRTVAAFEVEDIEQ